VTGSTPSDRFRVPAWIGTTATADHCLFARGSRNGGGKDGRSGRPVTASTPGPRVGAGRIGCTDLTGRAPGTKRAGGAPLRAAPAGSSARRRRKDAVPFLAGGHTRLLAGQQPVQFGGREPQVLGPEVLRLHRGHTHRGCTHRGRAHRGRAGGLVRIREAL